MQKKKKAVKREQKRHEKYIKMKSKIAYVNLSISK